MNKRREKILRFIVKEYIKTAKPVSSKVLFERYQFHLSSASLRNEMVKLTQDGYLFQPHASAGRVPTEKAYRFSVDKFCKPKLPSQIEEELKGILLERKGEEEILKEIGKFIAMASKSVSILLQDEEFFWQGLSCLLSQPEFYNTNEILEAIESFEWLYDIIGEELFGKEEGIKIYFPSGIIFKWQDKSSKFLAESDYLHKENIFLKDEDLSLILGGLENGLIGILGPTRMDYERNIALIEKTRELLAKVHK